MSLPSAVVRPRPLNFVDCGALHRSTIKQILFLEFSKCGESKFCRFSTLRVLFLNGSFALARTEESSVRSAYGEAASIFSVLFRYYPSHNTKFPPYQCQHCHRIFIILPCLPKGQQS